MKLKNLITGSIVAASLFGVSLGSSSLRVNANEHTSTNYPNNLKQSENNNSNGITKDGPSNPNLNDSKNTEAGANVDQGVLNLDNVPNLQFSTNDVNNYNTKLPYSGGNGDTTKGQNNNGQLQVTDNRNRDKYSDGQIGPWQVQASLGQFSRQEPNGTNTLSDDTWSIDLNSSNIINNDATPATVYNNNITTLSSNRGYVPILGTNNDKSQGYGRNTVTYSNSTNLNIPYNVKIGTYTANVSWTLMANADSGANDANNANNANNITGTNPQQNYTSGNSSDTKNY